MSAATGPAPPPGATGIPGKPDRRAELLGVTFALTAWATMFALARLYTRIFQTRSFGWDDGFITVALAAFLANMALTCAGIAHGQGQTIAVLDLSQVPIVMKFSNFAIFCNGIAMCAMKVGIGISLLRLNLSKRFNLFVYVAVVLSLIVNLTVFFGCFATCRPIERIWNLGVEGKCWPKWSSLAFSYTQTVGNIITDLLFTLGPLYYLRKVKVSKYNKWALRSVFLIGLIATAMAIAKATELPALQKTRDPTYDAVDLTIWVKAELAAGLFAASLPPLKSTFEQILRHVFHVHSGLTTPSATRTFKSNGYGGSHSQNGHNGGASGTFKSAHRSKHNSRGAMDSALEHGHPEYVMHTMGHKRGTGAYDGGDDGVSIDEDQKHILKTGSVKTGEGSEEDGGRGEWITKTIEYTVSDSMSERREDGRGMGRGVGRAM